MLARVSSHSRGFVSDSSGFLLLVNIEQQMSYSQLFTSFCLRHCQRWNNIQVFLNDEIV